MVLVVCAVQVSEIAGVKLDREVNVVAMADGQVLPLPPGSGMVSPDGKVCCWLVWGLAGSGAAIPLHCTTSWTQTDEVLALQTDEVLVFHRPLSLGSADTQTHFEREGT